MKITSVIRAGALAALAALALTGKVAAQGAYPNKPIKLIVPFAPGGSTDLVARLMAENMGKSMGQQVVVENQGGGGTIIGTQAAIKSPADGYTLLLGSTTLAINPGLRNDLPYDTLKDLQPVSKLSRIPYVLVANPKVGATSLKELIDKAKARPGSINVGSPGVGSGGHLASELFEMTAGVDFEHVPYKGTGPAITDLLGGQIDVMFGTILSVMPHIQSGKLVPLAVSIPERSASLPNVPTVAEIVPGYEASSWNSLLVPAGTPAPVVERLNAEIRKALQNPAVTKALEQDGAQPNPTTPDEFRAYLTAEIEKWRKVIRTANIKPE